MKDDESKMIHKKDVDCQLTSSEESTRFRGSMRGHHLMIPRLTGVRARCGSCVRKLKLEKEKLFTIWFIKDG